MFRLAATLVTAISFMWLSSSVCKAEHKCYDLGYRAARCVVMSFHGLTCNPGDDFSMPVECRGTPDMRRGFENGFRETTEKISSLYGK